MVPPLSSNFPCKIYIIRLLILRKFNLNLLLTIYRLPKGGKRPIVELVLRTPEGRYQPIKFRNNSQITENIPRTLFHKVYNLCKKPPFNDFAIFIRKSNIINFSQSEKFPSQILSCFKFKTFQFLQL